MVALNIISISQCFHFACQGKIIKKPSWLYLFIFFELRLLKKGLCSRFVQDNFQNKHKRITSCEQHGFRNTVKLGYNELGYNEQLVITNKFLSQIGYFTTQINPDITNPGYNEQKWSVPSCSL
jgi:hypothetical protein